MCPARSSGRCRAPPARAPAIRSPTPCIHGPGTTHLDAFAHVFFDGKMWNGYDVDGLVTMEEGAKKNSIMVVKDGLVTRGVLYDIPRLKGVPWLEPGHAHHGSGPGGVGGDGRREGRSRRCIPHSLGALGASGCAGGPFDTGREAAGLDNNVIPWLKERDVAIAGWEDARLRAAAGRGPAAHRAPQLRADDPGYPGARPRGFPGAGQCRRRAQPLGVHADHRDAADSERHRLAGQSDRHVLMHAAG